MEWKVAQFDLFHKSPKVTTRYLGSLCKNICHQSEQIFQNEPIWSHCFRTSEKPSAGVSYQA